MVEAVQMEGDEKGPGMMGLFVNCFALTGAAWPLSWRPCWSRAR